MDDRQAVALILTGLLIGRQLTIAEANRRIARANRANKEHHEYAQFAMNRMEQFIRDLNDPTVDRQAALDAYNTDVRFTNIMNREF